MCAGTGLPGDLQEMNSSKRCQTEQGGEGKPWRLLQMRVLGFVFAQNPPSRLCKWIKFTVTEISLVRQPVAPNGTSTNNPTLLIMNCKGFSWHPRENDLSVQFPALLWNLAYNPEKCYIMVKIKTWSLSVPSCEFQLYPLLSAWRWSHFQLPCLQLYCLGNWNAPTTQSILSWIIKTE